MSAEEYVKRTPDIEVRISLGKKTQVMRCYTLQEAYVKMILARRRNRRDNLNLKIRVYSGTEGTEGTGDHGRVKRFGSVHQPESIMEPGDILHKLREYSRKYDDNIETMIWGYTQYPDKNLVMATDITKTTKWLAKELEKISNLSTRIIDYESPEYLSIEINNLIDKIIMTE